VAEQEFYSFDEALKQLRLKEEELKRLVSEGEIRAFREGDTMKLRRSDVESLRSELSGGEVVDLGDAKEELVFEDHSQTDFVGMATQEISDVETILDEPVGEVAEIEVEEELDTIAVEVPDDVEVEVEAEPAAVPARGRRPAAAVVVEPEVEEPAEPGFVTAALILTSLILLLALPLALSAGGGAASGVASAIAGLFGHDLGG
jgi:excisionase family DNA binding protein